MDPRSRRFMAIIGFFEPVDFGSSDWFKTSVDLLDRSPQNSCFSRMIGIRSSIDVEILTKNSTTRLRRTGFPSSFRLIKELKNSAVNSGSIFRKFPPECSGNGPITLILSSSFSSSVLALRNRAADKSSDKSIFWINSKSCKWPVSFWFIRK